MKNPYTNTIKIFKKANTIFLQREADRVYISEGHVLFKVNAAVYDAFFRTEAACFIPLENGERAKSTGFKVLAEKQDSADIKKCMDRTIRESTQPITFTKFIMEIENSRGGKDQLRIVGNENFLVVINNNYFKAAEEFMDGNRAVYGSGSKAAVTCNDDEAGFLILPVNVPYVWEKKIDYFMVNDF